MACEPALELLPVDLAPYAHGNAGVPYATTFDSGEPGPHLMISALVHGNEICGAHALVHLIESEVRPQRGKLTLAFMNVAAYRTFDPANPAASRCLDEDFNRLWADDVLEGRGESRELARAREVRPLVESTDHLLDLHSMQTECAPLALAGTTARGLALARALGTPQHIVVDAGHAQGVRMRDFAAFGAPDGDKTALLVECGQHWKRRSRDVAIAVCFHFLRVFEAIAADRAHAAAPLAKGPQRVIEVTDAITAGSGRFRFADDYAGLEVIARAGTTIAYNGETPVKTPYDDCVLIMPSRRLRAGQTAIRLGRYAT